MVRFQFQLLRGYGNCCWEFFYLQSLIWFELRWYCSGCHLKVTYSTPWSTPAFDMLVFTSVMHKTAKCLEYICRRIFIRKWKVLSFYIWLRFRRKLTFRFYFRGTLHRQNFIQSSMEAVNCMWKWLSLRNCGQSSRPKQCLGQRHFT